MKGGAIIGRISLPTVRLRKIRMRYGRKSMGGGVIDDSHLILDDGGDLLLDSGGFILLD